MVCNQGSPLVFNFSLSLFNYLIIMTITILTSIISIFSVAQSQMTFAFADLSVLASRAQDNSSEKQIVIDRPLTLAEYVGNYFADAPVLTKVAWCESNFRHLTSDGSVLRGVRNKADIGIMQINELYHREKAKELGMDLDSLDGNLRYARYLYEKEGLQPWKASAACWKKTSADIAMTAVSG